MVHIQTRVETLIFEGGKTHENVLIVIINVILIS